MENDDSEVDFCTIMFDPAISIDAFGAATATDIGKGLYYLSVTGDLQSIDAIKPWEPPVLSDMRDGFGRPLNRPWEACVLSEKPMSTVDILAAELQMSEDDFQSMADDATLTINKRTLNRIMSQAAISALKGVDVLWFHERYLRETPPIHEQPKQKPEKSPKLHKLLFNPNDKV